MPNHMTIVSARIFLAWEAARLAGEPRPERLKGCARCGGSGGIWENSHFSVCPGVDGPCPRACANLLAALTDPEFLQYGADLERENASLLAENARLSGELDALRADRDRLVSLSLIQSRFVRFVRRTLNTAVNRPQLADLIRDELAELDKRAAEVPRIDEPRVIRSSDNSRADNSLPASPDHA